MGDGSPPTDEEVKAQGREDDDAFGDTRPVHAATVASFSLDREEVTVARFRSFAQTWPPPTLADEAGANKSIPRSGWKAQWAKLLPSTRDELSKSLSCFEGQSTWTDNAGANEAKPINCLDWYLAFAFCAWDGGRLPTEAEWEYAARGGKEQRPFPWGAAPADQGRAEFDCGGPCQSSSKLRGVAPAEGAGRWGHLALAGGVEEWVLDTYSPGFYGTRKKMGLGCVNCANLSEADPVRVLRGGAYTSSAEALRGVARSFGRPESRFATVGVRCAR